MPCRSEQFTDLVQKNLNKRYAFVRREASEFVITDLANMGIAQAELEMAGLIAHPDII